MFLTTSIHCGSLTRYTCRLGQIFFSTSIGKCLQIKSGRAAKSQEEFEIKDRKTAGFVRKETDYE